MSKFRLAFTSYRTYGFGVVPVYPVEKQAAESTDRKGYPRRPPIENYSIRVALPSQFKGQRLHILKNTGDCYLVLDTARFDPGTAIAWLKDGYHDNIRILDGDITKHEGPEYQYRPVHVTFEADEQMTADDFQAVVATITRRMNTLPGRWVERTTEKRRRFFGVYKIRAKSALLFSDQWDQNLQNMTQTLSHLTNRLVRVEPVPEVDKPMPFEPLDELEAHVGCRRAEAMIGLSERYLPLVDKLPTRTFPSRWPKPPPVRAPRSATPRDIPVESPRRKPSRAPTMTAGSALTADRLSAALQTLQITRSELARLLDVHERTVHRYERGDQPIPRSVEIIIKLMLQGATTAAEISKL